MLTRAHRSVIATLVAAAALAALLASPAQPAGAAEPDIPYFTEVTGPSVTLETNANPIVGHFTDQVFDDIFWYKPGPAKETMWTPCPDCKSGPFTKRQLPLALQVGGYYQPIVGDFAGNGLDDIYWLSFEGGDYLWTNTGAGTFTRKRFDMPAGDWSPLVLPDSRSGTGKDDILWQSGTETLARLWVFPDNGSGTARTKSRPRVPQGQPVVGDFDGNGAADVLFYPHQTDCRCATPVAAFATDTLWRRDSSEAAGFRATTLNIKGEYDPQVGRFSGQGDLRDDILWVGRLEQYGGSQDRPDALWEGRSNGAFAASTQSFPSAGGAMVLGHDIADTVVIFDGNESNVWFDTTSGPVLRPVGSQLEGIFGVIVGRFTSADRADILDRNIISDGLDTLYHPIF